MASDSFRFDGGKTWLDLFTTIGRRYAARPEERFVSAAAVSGWLASMELLPRETVTEDDVLLARRLREALRNYTAEVLGGEALLGPEAQLIREVLTWREHRSFSKTLQIGQFSTIQAVLAELTEQALLALQHPGQLSLCDEPDCRRAFSDPGGRRRWCPTPACASRGRVRSYRQQHQEAHRA